MTKHEIIDRIVASMSALYATSMKFFNRSTVSPKLFELLDQIELSIPDISGKGSYTARGRLGDMELTQGFTVLAWGGPNAPVYIFHHGSGDQPYYKRAEKILNKAIKKRIINSGTELTLVATNSPYNCCLKKYINAIGELEKFAHILTFSTHLIEAIIRKLKAQGASSITVSGISLGGWITNLHFSYYSTASEYRPIFAGAAPDALFLESIYSKLTAEKALNAPERLKEVLNFEQQFSARVHEAGKVYPLLAKYDQYVVLSRQKRIYLPGNIRTLNKGHVTGGAAYLDITRHLFEKKEKN